MRHFDLCSQSTLTPRRFRRPNEDNEPLDWLTFISTDIKSLVWPAVADHRSVGLEE
jgi:hypothetical protein